MDFSFTPEQEELRAYTRKFLSTEFPIEKVAELANSAKGWNPSTSTTLASLGWYDDDLSFLDLAVIYEEAGAALLPSTWFTSITLVRPLLADSDPLASRIAEGGARVTLAWAESASSPSLLGIPSTETLADASGALSGVKVLVPDLEWSDDAVVFAKTSDGSVGAFEVQLGGSPIRRQENLDSTRRFGMLTLDGLIGRQVTLREGFDPAHLRVRLIAAIACEAVGVARRALDIGTAYAHDRVQFGKAIGMYQGVSHPLADAFKEIELARSLAYRTAWAVDQGIAGEPEHQLIALAAKAQAGRAAYTACRAAIQTLGGIGMTWDHPIHRWLKRAMLLSSWEVDAASAADAIASSLLGSRTQESARSMPPMGG